MEAWKTDLYFGSTQIGEVDINRGIFQGGTRLLEKAKYGYNLNGVNVKPLLYMDDLKLYASSEKELFLGSHCTYF